MVEVTDAYLVLNAAVQLFGKGPAALDEEQRRQAEALAAKEGTMQARILASDEAAMVSVSEEEIEAARADIEKRYDSHADFLAELMRNGLNERSLTSSLANSLKVEKVLEQVAATVELTDAEIAEAYEASKQHFEHPELREARHILITINNDYPENRRKAVKQRIQQLRQQLRQQLGEAPESFADLALRHSECPTAMEGGYLGKLPKGKLYNELDRMLFAMQPGEISELIESPMGMHILKCERIYPAGTMPLAEAAELIRERLLAARRTAVQKQWIKRLFAH